MKYIKKEIDYDTMQSNIRERYIRNFNMFVNLCRDNGITPVVMTQPNMFDHHTDRLKEIYMVKMLVIESWIMIFSAKYILT